MLETNQNLDAQVRVVLDSIKDPCSVATGCPLGLDEMGLVKQLQIELGVVKVELRLTSPGCHFVSLLQQEAEERIGALAGVDAVEVKIVEDYSWSEADISAEGRHRLRWARQARLLKLKERVS
jgi:metal-sulfur cluster biosynthetic enzyme